MWLDETISANVARMPIERIVGDFSVNDFHPPVYYWGLNIWVKIFGSGVVAMRMSSVLFSLITIWLVYKIGKEIKDKKTGLWAAIILGANPLFVYFSQELRMYAIATMWLTGSLYFWNRLIKPKIETNWKDILGFNILALLSFLTFYGSVFLIAAMVFYFLIKKKYKLFFLGSLGILLAVLIDSPLLTTQLKNSANMLSQVTNWSLVLGKVNLKNLLLIPIKFSIGRIDWYPKIFYYGVSGIWTLIVFWQIFRGIRKNKQLGFLLIMPIVLATVFSFKSPMLQYFRFIYLIPILSLIIVLNNKQKNKKILIIGGFLIFSLIYLLNPNFYREDWKSVANNLNGDAYMIESFADPIKFYNPDVKTHDLRGKIDQNNIKVITYGEEIHGVNHVDILSNLGYQKIGEEKYRGVILENWEK